MTRNEGLTALHEYWIEQRDYETDRNLFLVALAQETLLSAGWLYIDDEQQVQPVRMTKSGVPQGAA